MVEDARIRPPSTLRTSHGPFRWRVFIACAFNYAVADDSSALHFINTWSFLSRSENEEAVPNLPVFKPWFINSCPLPIHLPRNFTDKPQDSVNLPHAEVVKKQIFSFSGESVAMLKIKANEESMMISSDKKINISSLQALLGHAWKAITRARELEPEEATVIAVIVECRNEKIEPAIPEHYFGNMGCGVGIGASAKELKEKSLGWAAMSLNKAINSYGEKDVYRWAESWCKEPKVNDLDVEKYNVVAVTGSNRFDMYGNDFGWGKPVGYTKYGRKMCSGVVSVGEGKEKGGIDLVIHLRERAMDVLLQDEEFMVMVS